MWLVPRIRWPKPNVLRSFIMRCWHWVLQDSRIRLNDRRRIRQMVTQIDAEDREVDVLVAIDKLDKIGRPVSNNC